jgi:2-amino-4-hydroxy-6-hydroxymethyldihydropteridine diphosphokinase/dihydropteroate synthase
LQLPSRSRSHSGCACNGGRRAKTAYVAFGSNLGDRVAEIERACNLMEERGIHVKRTSSLWETEPMYVKDQGQFVNGVCEVSTRMIPIWSSVPVTNFERDTCA